MRTVVGMTLNFLLCGVMLLTAVASGHHIWWRAAWYLLFAVFAALVYWISRWMRGPGSELGTAVPSLSLTERALDDEKRERG